MRVICLLCDSLNRHFLSMYGHDLAETPNLDWFAKKAFTLDRHFSGSLPTMPTRRELWTGNYEFLWRPWGALEPWDKELPRIIRNDDILTMLITDSYHLFEKGSGNYHFAFEGWEFFRGFENDPWVTEPTDMPEHNGNFMERYARNMRRMVNEEDLPPAKTLRCVDNWLQKNHTHERFFLMVDEFAPHEPFNTPEYLVKKYDPDYDGPLFFWPKYGRNIFSDGDLRHLRAAYSAHVTLLDKYIGRVFETMTNLDMWKDTAFILMTDHGHFLGEHGYTGKPSCPQYNTLVHIPLMIYVPGHEGNGSHINALTANVDLFPTILDLFGLKPETGIHGRSLMPLIREEKKSVRDWTLYGYFGKFINVTDGRMTYFRAPQRPEADLNIHSLRWEFGMSPLPQMSDSLEFGRFMKNVNMPVGRLPVSSAQITKGLFEPHNHLYSLEDDLDQEKNLAGSVEEKKYEDMLKKALESVDCPKEQFFRVGLD